MRVVVAAHAGLDLGDLRFVFVRGMACIAAERGMRASAFIGRRACAGVIGGSFCSLNNPNGPSCEMNRPSRKAHAVLALDECRWLRLVTALAGFDAGRFDPCGGFGFDACGSQSN